MRKKGILIICVMLFLFTLLPLLTIASAGGPEWIADFPKSLDSYHDSHLTDVGEILIHRIKQEPLNLVVSLLFLCAIIHTFCVGWFLRMAEKVEKAKRQIMKINGQQNLKYNGNVVDNVSFKAEVYYFFGEVEIVFGLWVVPVSWLRWLPMADCRAGAGDSASFLAIFDGNSGHYSCLIFYEALWEKARVCLGLFEGVYFSFPKSLVCIPMSRSRRVI